MASSLVFVNQKGDILIYRRYRDDVGYFFVELYFSLVDRKSPTSVIELWLPRQQKKHRSFVLMA